MARWRDGSLSLYRGLFDLQKRVRAFQHLTPGDLGSPCVGAPLQTKGAVSVLMSRPSHVVLLRSNGWRQGGEHCGVGHADGKALPMYFDGGFEHEAALKVPSGILEPIDGLRERLDFRSFKRKPRQVVEEPKPSHANPPGFCGTTG
jgi:hypothetical protein